MPGDPKAMLSNDVPAHTLTCTRVSALPANLGPGVDLCSAGAVAGGCFGSPSGSGASAQTTTVKTAETVVATVGCMGNHRRSMGNGNDKGPLSVTGSREGKKPCSTESSSSSSPISEAVRDAAEAGACEEGVAEDKVAGHAEILIDNQKMQTVCISSRKLATAPPMGSPPPHVSGTSTSVEQWLTDDQPQLDLQSSFSLPLPGSDSSATSAPQTRELLNSGEGSEDTNGDSHHGSEASSCEPIEFEPPQSPQLDAPQSSQHLFDKFSRTRTETLEYLLICSMSPRSAHSAGRDASDTGSHEGRRPSDDSASSLRSIEKFFDVIDKGQGVRGRHGQLLATGAQLAGDDLSAVEEAREASPLREWHM